MRLAWALRALPLAILAFQLYLPWSAKYFVTQDGPAHVYTAFVTQDLIFHRHTSPYHAIYRVQTTPLPNWTCTLLLAGFVGVFGPDHAEAFLVTFCLLAGYASITYCLRALAPRDDLLPVVGNWFLQSWFLWAGFYNFYLGMVLLPLVLGFWLRREATFTWRKAANLSGVVTLLFFTHLIPAALVLVALLLLGVWTWRGWRRFGMLAASLLPTAFLIALYTFKYRHAARYDAGAQAALLEFPQKIFIYSVGLFGEQRYLWAVILLIAAAALVTTRRREWKAAPGGLAVMAFVAFLLYLFVPDVGFGGSVVKMRFAWAVFLFAALMISCAGRLTAWRPVITLFLATFVITQLWVIAGHVRANSEAAAVYLAAMDRIPPSTRFVRMFFPVPRAKYQYRMNTLTMDPLLHLAELGAVRRHAVDLSDYQSATGTFSVIYKPSVGVEQRYSLWALESGREDSWASVSWLKGNLPVSIDYVVYVGDDPPANAPAGLSLIAANAGMPFVRIYRF